MKILGGSINKVNPQLWQGFHLVKDGKKVHKVEYTVTPDLIEQYGSDPEVSNFTYGLTENFQKQMIIKMQEELS